MTKSIMKKSKEVFENGIHPQAVDEVILKSIKTENLDWRYCAGDVVEKLVETEQKRTTMNLKSFL